MAAGQIIDEDPDLAMQHAIAARRLASRIAVVREAVGLAAYAAGDWPTAIAELRTYHRMSGRQTHLAELADCERALGRPERAIDLFRGADKDALDKAGSIELLIVAAGARGDLGQHDAAVAMLQVRELTADEDAEWAARLRYAYADALLAAGRRDEAREWFARAAAADDDNLTDAAERLLELDGVTLEDGGDDEDDDEPTAQAGDEDLEDDEDEPAGRLDDEDEEDEDGPVARFDDDEDLDDEDDDDSIGRTDDLNDEDLDGLPDDEDEDDVVVARAGLADDGGVPAASAGDEIDAGIDSPQTDPRVGSEDEKELVDEFVVEADEDDLAVEGGDSDGKPRS